MSPAAGPGKAGGEFRFRPVDQSTWKDFEALFESRGCPGYCWCMAWRMTPEELKRNDRGSRKKGIRQRVRSGIPIGLLAYAGGEPVAWCSIAPRETYRRLGGDESLDKVWSIACFFIKREYRHRGLVNRFIREAEAYARRHGAKYLEAYPVEPESPSYRFMGFVETFAKAGFRKMGKAGSRRHVMVRELRGRRASS